MPKLSHTAVRLLKRLSKGAAVATSEIGSDVLNELTARRYIEPAESVALNLDPIFLPNHAESWKITDVGRKALFEYRQERAKQIVEAVGIIASIAGLIIALFQSCCVR